MRKRMMLRVATFLMVMVMMATATGCGDTKTINGVVYDTYGLINVEKKNLDIAYEPIWGNIIWGIILVETIIAPIYFFGFSMFEPIGKKSPIKGMVPN